MLRIIQRYIAFKFLPPFLFSSLFFILFLLTFQLFRIVRIVTNKEVELGVVLELVMHIAISFFPHALPLSALISGIYAMNKLSEDSEIVAMRSFGIDKFQLFKPLLIFGVIISLFIFAVGQNIVPFSQKRFKNQVIKLTSKGVLTEVKAGHFFTEIPGVTLFAEDVYKKGEVLGNVFIHTKDKKKIMERVIFAKKGVLTKSKVGEWEIPNLRMHLTDGNIIQRYSNKQDVEKILFKDYEFPLFNENITPGLIKKNSMRSFKELVEIIFNKKKRKESGDGIYRTELEFWSRINTPLLVLLFIFLGFTLGIKKGRGRTKNTSTFAFIVLIAYYVLFFFGISFGQKGVINPAIAVFLPTLLLLALDVYLYKNLDWTT